MAVAARIQLLPWQVLRKAQEGKTAENMLSFFSELRRHCPAEQHIHIMMDSLSAHAAEDTVKRAKKNRVSFAPADASWLNPAECHIGGIQRLALKDTDCTTWLEAGAAPKKAIMYRNAQEEDA
jgi:hypothetical protein